jgi:hypothetical protein
MQRIKKSSRRKAYNVADRLSQAAKTMAYAIQAEEEEKKPPLASLPPL